VTCRQADVERLFLDILLKQRAESKGCKRGEIKMPLVALLPYVAVLACPIAMALMMWLMSKNMGGHTDQTRLNEQTPSERLAVLRQQRQALEAKIAEVTRIAELEAERERTLVAHAPVADGIQPSDVVLQR
jgi:hypothetical protein